MYEEIKEYLSINPDLYYKLSSEYQKIPEIYLTFFWHRKVEYSPCYLDRRLASDQKVFDIIFERKMYNMFHLMDEEIIKNNFEKIIRVYDKLPSNLKTERYFIDLIVERKNYYQMFLLISDGREIDISKDTCLKIIESVINKKDFSLLDVDNLQFEKFFENIDVKLRNDVDVFLSFIELYCFYRNDCIEDIFYLFVRSNDNIKTNYDIIKKFVSLLNVKKRHFDAVKKFITKEIAIKLIKDNIDIYHTLPIDLKQDVDITCQSFLTFNRIDDIINSNHKDNKMIGKALLLGSSFSLHDLQKYSQKLYKDRKFLKQSIPKYFQFYPKGHVKIIDDRFFLWYKIKSFNNILYIL